MACVERTCTYDHAERVFDEAESVRRKESADVRDRAAHRPPRADGRAKGVRDAASDADPVSGGEHANVNEEASELVRL